MKSYGIGYRQVDLKDGEPDLPAIKAAAADENIKLVFIPVSYTHLDVYKRQSEEWRLESEEIL